MKWREARGLLATPAVDEAKEARKAGYAERDAAKREVRRKANAIERLRRRHGKIEAELQTIEAEQTGRMAQITAAGESGDVARVEQLGREYAERDARFKALWAEWEDIGGQLERAGRE